MLDSPRWTRHHGLCREHAAAAPLYYIQTIAGGRRSTARPTRSSSSIRTPFIPSLKAWLFLTDVADDDRPLTYVAGSHRADARARWRGSAREASTVIDDADRLSQRGSLRIEREELAALGLPQPTRFAVPANTLVAIDTSGFHARADSDRPTLRVELWAYCRRSPFLPWTGGDLLSWRPLAIRRAGWLAARGRRARRARVDDPALAPRRAAPRDRPD